MQLAKFLLTPNEKKRYEIEYGDWLDSSEIIISKSFVVQDVTVPPLVISGDQIDINGTLISFFVNGGVNLTQYDVIVQITTSNGQIKEDHIIYDIKDA